MAPRPAQPLMRSLRTPLGLCATTLLVSLLMLALLWFGGPFYRRMHGRSTSD